MLQILPISLENGDLNFIAFMLNTLHNKEATAEICSRKKSQKMRVGIVNGKKEKTPSPSLTKFYVQKHSAMPLKGKPGAAVAPLTSSSCSSPS